MAGFNGAGETIAGGGQLGGGSCVKAESIDDFKLVFNHGHLNATAAPGPSSLATLFAVLDVNIFKLGAELIGELVADIDRAVLAASAANGNR